MICPEFTRVFHALRFIFLSVCLSFVGCTIHHEADNLSNRIEIQELVDLGDFEGAAAKIDSLPLNIRNHSDFLFIHGQCLQGLGDINGAINLFSKALSNANPDSCTMVTQILNHRAFAYRTNSQQQLSLKDYLRAHSMGIQCPNSTKWDSLDNIFNAGMIAVGIGNFLLADSIANALIASHPIDPDGYEIKAKSLVAKGELPEAIQVYDHLLQNSDSPMGKRRFSLYFDNRAQLHLQQNDLLLACSDWQKALDLGLQEAQAKLDSFCAKVK